ncbi:MAG: hypothetical protein K0S00_1340 [Xanthobacteraceae bacterium]|jgi:hypothetical protein|nr:hypothetical protein [Xanthobacteraceae bacterium]
MPAMVSMRRQAVHSVPCPYESRSFRTNLILRCTAEGRTSKDACPGAL